MQHQVTRLRLIITDDARAKQNRTRHVQTSFPSGISTHRSMAWPWPGPSPELLEYDLSAKSPRNLSPTQFALPSSARKFSLPLQRYTDELITGNV
jgi:hypothetical protein